MKKLKSSLIEEILNSHTKLLGRFFGKPKINHTLIESKEGKTLSKMNKHQIDGKNALKSYTMIQ